MESHRSSHYPSIDRKQAAGDSSISSRISISRSLHVNPFALQDRSSTINPVNTGYGYDIPSKSSSCVESRKSALQSVSDSASRQHQPRYATSSIETTTNHNKLFSHTPMQSLSSSIKTTLTRKVSKECIRNPSDFTRCIGSTPISADSDSNYNSATNANVNAYPAITYHKEKQPALQQLQLCPSTQSTGNQESTYLPGANEFLRSFVATTAVKSRPRRPSRPAVPRWKRGSGRAVCPGKWQNDQLTNGSSNPQPNEPPISNPPSPLPNTSLDEIQIESSVPLRQLTTDESDSSAFASLISTSVSSTTVDTSIAQPSHSMPVPIASTISPIMDEAAHKIPKPDEGHLPIAMMDVDKSIKGSPNAPICDVSNGASGIRELKPISQIHRISAMKGTKVRFADVVIIGAGAAGLACAEYLTRYAPLDANAATLDFNEKPEKWSTRANGSQPYRLRILHLEGRSRTGGRVDSIQLQRRSGTQTNQTIDTVTLERGAAFIHSCDKDKQNPAFNIAVKHNLPRKPKSDELDAWFSHHNQVSPREMHHLKLEFSVILKYMKQDLIDRINPAMNKLIELDNAKLNSALTIFNRAKERNATMPTLPVPFRDPTSLPSSNFVTVTPVFLDFSGNTLNWKPAAKTMQLNSIKSDPINETVSQSNSEVEIVEAPERRHGQGPRISVTVSSDSSSDSDDSESSTDSDSTDSGTDNEDEDNDESSQSDDEQMNGSQSEWALRKRPSNSSQSPIHMKRQRLNLSRNRSSYALAPVHDVIQEELLMDTSDDEGEQRRTVLTTPTRSDTRIDNAKSNSDSDDGEQELVLLTRTERLKQRPEPTQSRPALQATRQPMKSVKSNKKKKQSAHRHHPGEKIHAKQGSSSTASGYARQILGRLQQRTFSDPPLTKQQYYEKLQKLVYEPHPNILDSTDVIMSQSSLSADQKGQSHKLQFHPDADESVDELFERAKAKLERERFEHFTLKDGFTGGERYLNEGGYRSVLKVLKQKCILRHQQGRVKYKLLKSHTVKIIEQPLSGATTESHTSNQTTIKPHTPYAIIHVPNQNTIIITRFVVCTASLGIMHSSINHAAQLKADWEHMLQSNMQQLNIEDDLTLSHEDTNNKKATILFSPPLTPFRAKQWLSMRMGLENKVILVFPARSRFWPNNVQVLRSVNHPSWRFFNMDNIIDRDWSILVAHRPPDSTWTQNASEEFDAASQRWAASAFSVEHMTDEEALTAVMKVLHEMFGSRNKKGLPNIEQQNKIREVKTDPDDEVDGFSAESDDMSFSTSDDDESESRARAAARRVRQLAQKQSRQAILRVKQSAAYHPEVDEKWKQQPVVKPIYWEVTRWASDPFAKGAYSFVPTGVEATRVSILHAWEPSARTSAVPSNPANNSNHSMDGVLLFAGEALSALDQQQVHGAMGTGVEAAQKILKRIQLQIPV